MLKIYIMGGIIFIVIKCVHISELYYNFYFLHYENTLVNPIQCEPGFQGNVIVYLSSFIPKFYGKFCRSNVAEAMLRQGINLLYLLLIEGTRGAN